MRGDHGDGPQAEFAADLSALRDRAGSPSYETLAALTHRCSEWPQQRSTIYDKLAGNSAPTEHFVIAFVDACALYAQERGTPLSVQDADSRSWAERCAQVLKRIADARRLRRASVAQEPPADMTFRPIGRWTPTGLGIHTAIKVPGSAPWQQTMPRYVERRHDRWLRELLTESPGEPTMIALVGGAASGKTRSAYEAVKRCLRGRPLVVPGAPAELAGLLADELPADPCVVWIDNARAYLYNAAAAQALHDLLCRGYREVVVIATLWPVYWNDIYSPPGEKSSEEFRFWARRVLELAIRVDVPDGFDRADMARAEETGRGDPRIATAIRDCGPQGQVTQVLAAGPGLVHYYDGADAIAKAVLTAAMDARRLGYVGLVSAEFLRGSAVGYLSGEHRAGPSAGWFAQAVRGCTAKIHEAVAPLTPVRTSPGVGVADGYKLADFLDQAGRDILREQPVPSVTWDTLADFVTEPAPRTALAREAERRGLLQYAYLLAKPAAEDGGDVSAAGIVAAQYLRWGNTEKAADLWRRAAEHHDSHSMCRLAECAEERDDQRDADGWWRAAADLGNPYAVFQYSQRLDRRGEPHEAENVLRRAALAGEPHAFQELMSRWESQGRLEEAKALQEAVTRNGHLMPAQSIAGPFQLVGVPTKAGHAVRSEDQQALRRAADQGHCGAMSNLAVLLERDGQTAEADVWWARAADEGHPPAIRHLAEAHLSAGETEQAEKWLLRLADAQDTRALWYLADLRDRTGHRAEAEQFLRCAVSRGDRHALQQLTERLLQAGREPEAESAMRGALENGHVGSLPELAHFIEKRGRGSEAHRLKIYGIDPGGATAQAWGPDVDRS